MTETTDTPDLITDVLVVGAGPVGLTLANVLGGFGTSAIVLEDLPSLIDYPRGVGIDDECLRSFQAIGLAEQVYPHVTPNHIQRFVNGKGRLLAEIGPTNTEYGWPRKNGFIQPLVDAELCKGLDRYDHVRVLFQHRLRDYTEDATGVVATIETPKGEQRIRAQYLVGCDGGRSTVRHAMGVSFEGQSSSTRWLVIDVRNDPIGTPNAYLGADPERPYVSIGLPHGIRRFEFMLFDHEPDSAVDDPAFVHRLLGKLVDDPAGLAIIRQRAYTHHARIAGAFRQGRVLIAGDAAHLMPVWQGQGYNSGIRDATNLGWKLHAVTAGIADEKLLDTYDQERRAHAMGMIRISVLAGQVISPTNKAIAGTRDFVFRGLNRFPAAKRYVTEFRFKPMPRYTEGAVVIASRTESSSPVGRLIIQPHVDTHSDKGVAFDEVLGPWFAMVSWINDPAALLDIESKALLGKLGTKLISVRPVNQLTWPDKTDPSVTIVGDVDGSFKRWFDKHPSPVVFVRPDRFVAASCLAQEASNTARELAAALHLTSEVRS